MYFNSPKTLEELRNEYKKLCFQFHPDVSGFDSTDIMKQINLEYENLSNELAKGSKFVDSEMEFSALYKEKIEALIKIKGILIEIIGNWIWVTGETKANKEYLKELKFSYAPKKQAWFFKNYVYHKKTSEKDLDTIREMYGSTVVSNSKREDEQRHETNQLAFS